MILSGYALNDICGQTALNIKYGILSMRLADDSTLNGASGVRHGRSFGLDAIVEDSRFLFMPGLHYQHYAVQRSDVRGGLFARRASIHHIHLPLNFGSWIAAGRHCRIRVFAGVHGNFLTAVDDNAQGLNTELVTRVQPGVQAGSQVRLWRITFDIRYSHDLRNVIHARPESRLRGWGLYAGVVW